MPIGKFRIVDVTINGDAPYQQCDFLKSDKEQEESHKDYEKRCWKERCHVDSETGKCFIPANAFTQAVQLAAQHEGRKIEGKRNATWTKHFARGIMCQNNLMMDYTPDTCHADWQMRPANPSSPKSGGRVLKCYPLFARWGGVLRFVLLDPVITKDIFQETVEVAGILIGVGVWRPANGGQYGRFLVEKFNWSAKA